jgi:hypothetical protein
VKKQRNKIGHDLPERNIVPLAGKMAGATATLMGLHAQTIGRRCSREKIIFNVIKFQQDDYYFRKIKE